MASTDTSTQSAEPEPASEEGHSRARSVEGDRAVCLSSSIQPRPCAAWEVAKPTATAMQTRKANICAPRIGRVTRSIAGRVTQPLTGLGSPKQ